MKISIDTNDLWIKKMPQGNEAVQFSSKVAFDPKFVQEMKDLGVRTYLEKQEETIKNKGYWEKTEAGGRIWITQNL